MLEQPASEIKTRPLLAKETSRFIVFCRVATRIKPPGPEAGKSVKFRPGHGASGASFDGSPVFSGRRPGSVAPAKAADRVFLARSNVSLKVRLRQVNCRDHERFAGPGGHHPVSAG